MASKKRPLSEDESKEGSKYHFHFEESEYDGLLIVFICDGQSDSISINIVISIDRLVVYTTEYLPKQSSIVELKSIALF